MYPGSNGYACRYPNGEWGYIVTKSNFEATKDVVVNGWISPLGGGYFNPKYRG
ncbi:garvicin Q family class II bacteriocin [Streptococcus pseudoporcinus]|uniref:garvicin Q family class II bacteriocin n=1 Tax=Streptococcus pseudoporcinus TaxID=361101 RepID=UPI001E59114F|nr:garvicin Q family class II bacteriocin [Streptococcus pseudoporcinus]